MSTDNELDAEEARLRALANDKPVEQTDGAKDLAARLRLLADFVEGATDGDDETLAEMAGAAIDLTDAMFDAVRERLDAASEREYCAAYQDAIDPLHELHADTLAALGLTPPCDDGDDDGVDNGDEPPF